MFVSETLAGKLMWLLYKVCGACVVLQAAVAQCDRLLLLFSVTAVALGRQLVSISKFKFFIW